MNNQHCGRPPENEYGLPLPQPADEAPNWMAAALRRAEQAEREAAAETAPDPRAEILAAVQNADMHDFAQYRAALGLDELGMDKSQRQMMGYRGLSLPPQMPGAEYAAAARALSAETDAARREANIRNHAAAQQLYGFRRPTQ